jgi:hypothetical protein
MGCLSFGEKVKVTGCNLLQNRQMGGLGLWQETCTFEVHKTTTRYCSTASPTLKPNSIILTRFGKPITLDSVCYFSYLMIIGTKSTLNISATFNRFLMEKPLKMG